MTSLVGAAEAAQVAPHQLIVRPRPEHVRELVGRPIEDRRDVFTRAASAAQRTGDVKRLRGQALSDLMQLRSERTAAKAAGRVPAFCPPEGGVKLSDKDVMDAMQAVPEAARERTDTKDAWRSYMAHRFPCRT